MIPHRALERVLGARLAYPVIALALLCVFGVNEWLHQRTRSQLEEGRLLAQSRTQAMEALQSLTDAETAQRGFLITGRAEYLQPYEAALVDLPGKLNPTFEFLSKAGAGAGADADAARQL